MASYPSPPQPGHAAAPALPLAKPLSHLALWHFPQPKYEELFACNDFCTGALALATHANRASRRTKDTIAILF